MIDLDFLSNVKAEGVGDVHTLLHELRYLFVSPRLQFHSLLAVTRECHMRSGNTAVRRKTLERNRILIMIVSVFVKCFDIAKAGSVPIFLLKNHLICEPAAPPARVVPVESLGD